MYNMIRRKIKKKKKDVDWMLINFICLNITVLLRTFVFFFLFFLRCLHLSVKIIFLLYDRKRNRENNKYYWNI